MSWKSFACVAALAALVAPAAAQPVATINDLGGGAGEILITTDVAGSLGAELALELTDSTLASVTINTALFDEANPGDSPFIPGVAIGGDVTGLDVDLANNRAFAAYGSGDLGIGTFKFADFTFSGSGTADLTGNVAQLGLNNSQSDLLVDITDGGGLFGDFEPDGDVDIIDFGVFADAFDTVTGDAAYNAAADSEPDGDVDIIDFGLFADNFGIGTASAVPEPTTAVLGLVGLACLGVRRRV